MNGSLKVVMVRQLHPTIQVCLNACKFEAFSRSMIGFFTLCGESRFYGLAHETLGSSHFAIAPKICLKSALSLG